MFTFFLRFVAIFLSFLCSVLRVSPETDPSHRDRSVSVSTESAAETTTVNNASKYRDIERVGDGLRRIIPEESYTSSSKFTRYPSSKLSPPRPHLIGPLLCPHEPLIGPSGVHSKWSQRYWVLSRSGVPPLMDISESISSNNVNH